MHDDLPTMELDRTENALRDIVTQHQLIIEDGLLHVPRTPGLGVEVDMDALGKVWGKRNR